MTAAPQSASKVDETRLREDTLVRAPSGPIVEPSEPVPTREAFESIEVDHPSRMGMFNALAPLITDVMPVGRELTEPGQAPASSSGRPAANDARRRALQRAIAELAETHAVAADLAAQHATIDLPLDLPDPQAGSIHQVNSAASDAVANATQALIVPDMIRACRDRVANLASPGDRMKIDIVATLFDHVLADDRLPTSVRNSLARMQLPVLRIALSDDSFFASRTHPTRRLLDRLATTAAQWDFATDEGRACRGELERVVHAVVQGPHDDASAHAKLLEGFEYNIAAISTASRILPTPVFTDPEDRDVLIIKATIQISQLLAGVDVDRAVRFFLLDVWSRVLVEIACGEPTSARDATLARAKRLCTDLAWSAAPKTTSGERARLAGVLPTMIAALRDGMALIQFPKAEEERFFSQWTRAMYQATRRLHLAPDARGAGFPDDPIPLDKFEIDVFVKSLREGTFGVETQRPHVEAANTPIDEGLTPLGEDPPSLLRTDMSGERRGRGPRAARTGDPRPVIELMTKGAWFELREARGFSRVRLSWISPLKSFYLFVGADSAITRSYDPEALKELVERGDLRRIDA